MSAPPYRMTAKPARFFFLVLVLLLSACSPSNDTSNISKLKLGDGQHWVFINYWAIWCKPCTEEVPQLNQFAANHADKVLVYGVNYDGITGAELLDQAKQLNIQFTLLEQDPGKQIGVPHPQVLPATVVISPDGSIKDILYGPQTVSSLEQAMTAGN